MASLRYSEGDLFCVPVGAGRYMLGVIARVAPGGKVILVYVFGELLTEVPREARIPSRDSSVLVARVGDLGLIDRSWPLVTRRGRWDRKRWPLPAFGRVEPIGGRAWRVEYQNEDPNGRPRETLVTPAEAKGLPIDSLYGSVALERFLAKRLGVPAQPSTPGQRMTPTAFHLVRCKSSTDARDVVLLLRQRGLAAEIRAGGDDCSVVVRQPLPTSPSTIREHEAIIRAIAAECGAEYDGFERDT